MLERRKCIVGANTNQNISSAAKVTNCLCSNYSQEYWVNEQCTLQTLLSCPISWHCCSIPSEAICINNSSVSGTREWPATSVLHWTLCSSSVIDALDFTSVFYFHHLNIMRSSTVIDALKFLHNCRLFNYNSGKWMMSQVLWQCVYLLQAHLIRIAIYSVTFYHASYWRYLLYIKSKNTYLFYCYFYIKCFTFFTCNLLVLLFKFPLSQFFIV